MTGLPQIVHGASDGEPLQARHSTQLHTRHTTATYVGRSMLPAGGVRRSSDDPQALHTGRRPGSARPDAALAPAAARSRRRENRRRICTRHSEATAVLSEHRVSRRQVRHLGAPGRLAGCDRLALFIEQQAAVARVAPLPLPQQQDRFFG